MILLTGYGTVETAVEAMKEGAYDFITKPFKKAVILMSTHGLSGLGKLLIGSTTEKVVRKSDVPILTVNKQPIFLPQQPF